jgi:uncharacterized membrane protein YhaH (DUF805 family)
VDYAWFLFSFEGRIYRARYFLAGLIVGCWILFLAIVVFCIAKTLGSAPLSLGLKTDDIFGLVDPESFRSLASAQTVPLLFKVMGMPLLLGGVSRRLGQAAARPRQKRLVDGSVFRGSGSLPPI